MSVPVVRIEAGRWNVRAMMRESWDRRDLLRWFVWRDLKVRFKQTALGPAWIVLQPLALMLVFAVFLGNLAEISSDGYPYPLFAYVALVPWTFFNQTVVTAAGSVLGNTALITKVYFPRYFVPLGAALARIVDVLIAGCLIIVLTPFFDATANFTGVLLMPLYALLAWLTALGVGLVVAAVSVRFRDVQQALPLILQVWLFATPVAYSASLVPERWRSLYSLNPMVVVVQGFRAGPLGAAQPNGRDIAVAVSACALLLIAGLVLFRRSERSMADIV